MRLISSLPCSRNGTPDGQPAPGVISTLFVIPGTRWRPHDSAGYIEIIPCMVPCDWLRACSVNHHGARIPYGLHVDYNMPGRRAQPVGRRDSAPSSASGTSQSKSPRSGGPSPSGSSWDVHGGRCAGWCCCGCGRWAGARPMGVSRSGPQAPRRAAGSVAQGGRSSIAGCAAAGAERDALPSTAGPRRLHARAYARSNISLADRVASACCAHKASCSRHPIQPGLRSARCRAHWEPWPACEGALMRIVLCPHSLTACPPLHW